jgi:hypothetical protein
LPEGGQAHDTPLGGAFNDARGAVSSDGSRVFWTVEEPGDAHLFVRDVASERTVRLDAVQGGVVGEASKAVFQFASSDGSRVFFTDPARLTEDSTAGGGEPDLYECELVERAGGLSCVLSDLTVDSGGHADVRGVVLAGSDSSSYLYFVAQGKLTEGVNAQGGRAEVGADNLYMLHFNEGEGGWEAPVFIAALSGEDEPDWGGPGVLERTTSRVSPDGKFLVFMSDVSLTGYDNRDVNSGVRDEEVYLYRAPSVSAGPGRLVCVSCNPSGRQPAGVLSSSEASDGRKGLLVDEQAVWVGRWLAGSVPGWTAIHLEDAVYQSRYLSDEGRVFFDSPDALVPQATSGLESVYEYEPEGVPASGPYACTRSSATFSASADGCVALISSGSAVAEAAFLDASGMGPGGEEGEDVFFLTSAPLVPGDIDGAFDVYDAHVCSVAAPCPAAAVAPVPACASADACRALAPPVPSVFGSPSSATFSGAGNLAPPVSPPAMKARKKTVRCARGKRLSHGKCVKVKARAKAKGKASQERRVGG